MNLALPALVLLLALLPGAVARKSYASGRFPREISEQGAFQELAIYLLLAIPIDLVGYHWFEHRAGLPTFEQSFALIAGNLDGNAGAALASELAEHTWSLIATAYGLVILGAWVLGTAARRVVWASRLDVIFPFLRIRSDWYYLLQGRLAGLPRRVLSYADVLVEHESKTRLYRGLVRSFEVDREGGLRELILDEAKRLSRVSGPDGADAFRWKEIPGSRFVVLGSKIHNINLQYVSVTTRPAGPGAGDRSWWRSFWSEDP